MNKKPFFFLSILVLTVPRWNGIVHIWQKLWDLEQFIKGSFGVWRVKCAKYLTFGTSSMDALRASALKNTILSYFTIPKSYFINYTISFYNTPYIQKLYYFTFSLKYYFFNLSLLFLSHHHFFSVKGWNKIYIYIF